MKSNNDNTIIILIKERWERQRQDAKAGGREK